MEEASRRVWGVGSPRTLRVHWILAELALPYRCEEVPPRSPGMEAPEFLARTLRRKVPFFEGDGVAIGESGAIVAYLADRNRDRVALIPEAGTPERAVSDDRSFFVLTEIDAPLYTIRKHEGLPQVYGASETAVAAARDYAKRRLAEATRWLTQRGEYVLGDAFGTADLLLGSCLEWARVVGIELDPVLQDYRERLAARPSYAAALERNFPPGALSAVMAGPS